MPCHFHIYTFPYSMYHHNSSAKKIIFKRLYQQCNFYSFLLLTFSQFSVHSCTSGPLGSNISRYFLASPKIGGQT